MCKKLMFLMSLVLVIGLAVPASADQLLASYEEGEFDPYYGTGLTLDAHADGSDLGLMVTPVLASDVGLTATDGVNILQWAFGEADGKVEVKHMWSNFTFSLTGENYLVYDVYFATEVTPMTVIGMWDDVIGWSGEWAPPVALNTWHTVYLPVADPFGSPAMDHIHAYLFEGMSADFGIIYTDNLRTSAVPEPATIALLGLGGLALLRRKR